MTDTTITSRLEYLRGEIRAERISYGELAELAGLAEHIAPGDVELLEWAGVPEHPDDPEPTDLDTLTPRGRALEVHAELRAMERRLEQLAHGLESGPVAKKLAYAVDGETYPDLLGFYRGQVDESISGAMRAVQNARIKVQVHCGIPAEDEPEEAER